MHDQIAVAAASRMVRHDGRVYRLRRRITVAHVTDPLVEQHPDLWKITPVGVLPEPEQSDGEASSGADRPGARDPRATWDAYAASLGLDVDDCTSKADVIALVDAHENG